eukprot:UN33736
MIRRYFLKPFLFMLIYCYSLTITTNRKFIVIKRYFIHTKFVRLSFPYRYYFII